MNLDLLAMAQVAFGLIAILIAILIADRAYQSIKADKVVPILFWFLCLLAAIGALIASIVRK